MTWKRSSSENFRSEIYWKYLGHQEDESGNGDLIGLKNENDSPLLHESNLITKLK